MSIRSTDLSNDAERLGWSPGGGMGSVRALLAGTEVTGAATPGSRASQAAAGLPSPITRVGAGDSPQTVMRRLDKELSDVEANARAARVIQAFLPDHGRKRALTAARGGAASAALRGESLRGIARAAAVAAGRTYTCPPATVAEATAAVEAALSSVPGIMALAAADNIDKPNAATRHKLSTIQVGDEWRRRLQHVWMDARWVVADGCERHVVMCSQAAVEKCSEAATAVYTQWYKERRYGNMMRVRHG